jgi:hypothetical protein
MMREERILATIACHSAVKLGDRLSQPETEALIREWLTSRLPATCPHGRSICYRIPIKEMARKLDRHLMLEATAFGQNCPSTIPVLYAGQLTAVGGIPGAVLGRRTAGGDRAEEISQ